MSQTNKITSTIAPLRASEWWESKFGPLFGTIYATALLLEIPFIDLFPFLAFLLIALLPGASFVSVINDWTDLEEDQQAGKKNRLVGKSKFYVFSLISICLVLGIIVSFFLSKISFSLYLSAWIAFTLYSLPPFRFKGRGILGVLADTLGANVFPQLFAVSLLFDWFEKPFDFVWLVLIGGWAFLLGLRGILSHQLTDKKMTLKPVLKPLSKRFKIQPLRKFLIAYFSPWKSDY